MKSHICEILRGADNITKFSFYRKQAGIKQKELAKKLNVDQGAISHWENGRNKPSQKYIKKLCRIFGCTAEELMGEADNDSG